jgi:hypothetical protein
MGSLHRPKYVRSHLPKHLQPVVTFAYITGWRIRSEILPLTWHELNRPRPGPWPASSPFPHSWAKSWAK